MMKSKFLGVFLVISLFGIKEINAQTNVSNAQAMFIYNFLSHIQWPDNQIGNNITIGVIGKTDTYASLVDYTKNRVVGSRAIQVKQCSNIEELQTCNVILVAFNSSNQIENISKRYNSKACLIVSEKPGTAVLGSVIEFELVQDKLRYRISKANAAKHDLFVSAVLLKMSL